MLELRQDSFLNGTISCAMDALGPMDHLTESGIPEFPMHFAPAELARKTGLWGRSKGRLSRSVIGLKDSDGNMCVVVILPKR